ncbi:MAG: sulfatase-like hydrolase/transferase [Porticoccaceae bacterium]
MDTTTRSSAGAPRTLSWLAVFALLSWGHMLVVTAGLLDLGLSDPLSLRSALFHFAAWPVYSLLYIAPALSVALLAAWLAPSWPRLAMVSAAAASVLCLLYVQADSMIYQLYNFHFNGFVLNLLVTRGGVESLGSGSETYISMALIAARIVVIQLVLVVASRRLAAWRPGSLRPALALAASLWVLAVVVQGVGYGVADIRKDGAVLDTARVYPFFKKVRFRTLAAHFGFEAAPRHSIRAEVDTARLDYPRQQVAFERLDDLHNIIWLVAESLRWDRLQPDIMPNTWALAGRSLHFTRHYSTGNGTRESLFGMFYGLYGSYWQSFLTARRSPLLMDRIIELGYQLDLRTSAQFSYPEFDKTLFARVPLDSLHEGDYELPPWQRDEVNTTALVEALENRDRARPFMGFYFLESTHARYSFPEHSAPVQPYAEEVNYARMSREDLLPRIDLIRNRYSNAAHWVDAQVGRIVAALESEGMLDDTIVIVTGDHGEEFLEKGSWGHNSHFVDEQTRVPLVVWLPGQEPRAIDRTTSHMDIATTLLQLLGATGPVANYSLGRHLLSIEPRDFIAISDWHSIGVLTPELKFRIPYLNRGDGGWEPTGPADEPLDDDQEALLIERNTRQILTAIDNNSQFLKKSQRAANDEDGKLAM